MSLIRDEEPPLFKTSDQNFTKRKIEEDQDIKKSEVIKTSIALRLTKYLVTTRTEDAVEFLNAGLSFILTLFFALDTYPNGTSDVIQYIELVIVIYLSADYILFFYISENRLLFIF